MKESKSSKGSAKKTAKMQSENQKTFNSPLYKRFSVYQEFEQYIYNDPYLVLPSHRIRPYRGDI